LLHCDGANNSPGWRVEYAHGIRRKKNDLSGAIHLCILDKAMRFAFIAPIDAEINTIGAPRNNLVHRTELLQCEMKSGRADRRAHAAF